MPLKFLQDKIILYHYMSGSEKLSRKIGQIQFKTALLSKKNPINLYIRVCFVLNAILCSTLSGYSERR